MMSDRPFAVILPDGSMECAGIRTTGGGELRSYADQINAAYASSVEQREARLVGALREVIRYDDTAWGNTEPWPSFRPVAAKCRAALEGHGDYVPRAALDEANAKLAQMTGAWAKAFDVLIERDAIDMETLATLAGQLGVTLMSDEVVWTNMWQAMVAKGRISDDALITEFQRRFENITPIRARDSLRAKAAAVSTAP